MIPKIVHQIWIGSEPPPLEMMETWQRFCRERGWVYRLWTDERDPLCEVQSCCHVLSYLSPFNIRARGRWPEISLLSDLVPLCALSRFFEEPSL